MTHPTEVMNDEQFVRRIYLDVAGRIPTYDETVAFLDSRERDKRGKLINDLLDSEAFVSNFFNYYSDLLRVRDGISMNGINGLKANAYADWLKDQIRANTPWNTVVAELVAAEGYFWDNPATGYMLTDMGMQLCNLSNTFTIFTGTEITCAQCHDHPFEEVYQMDFYKMAAFFGRMEYGIYPGETGELKKVADAQRKAYQEEWKKRNEGKTPMPRFDQQLEDILGSYRYHLGDGSNNKTKLPHDYKYDDAEPNQTIEPSAYFGDIVKLEDYESPRKAFAAWLTSKDNPRFTVNIVNRLWKHVFGLAQIEPVHNIPGHLDGQAQNYELLQYLEQLMKDLDYSMKDFLRVLYNTQSYQREANHYSPTLAQIDQGEYHFSAPVMRRMSAEQIWDSMVALTIDQPEAIQRRVLEDYREFMHTDWSKLSLDQALEFKAKYASMGAPSMMMEGEESMMDAVQGGRRGDMMIRASEMRLPENVGSILYEFGQSDKQLIENANRLGSIPQVMMMLNGNMTNQMMIRDNVALVKRCKEAGESKGIDVAFLSILQRRPSSDEAQASKSLVNGDDFSDLIWALLNTREFMFIQ
jgi:hypothetical protein